MPEGSKCYEATDQLFWAYIVSAVNATMLSRLPPSGRTTTLMNKYTFSWAKFAKF